MMLGMVAGCSCKSFRPQGKLLVAATVFSLGAHHVLAELHSTVNFLSAAGSASEHCVLCCCSCTAACHCPVL